MSEWKTVRLGDVATYINGYAFKPSDWGTTGLPIIRIQNLTGNDYETNFFNGEIHPKYTVKDGDVLISWSASLGVYEWNKGKALLNQHIFKVVFDKIEVDKKYFIFTVSHLLNEMAKHTHGSTMRHITKPDFDNMPFPLPSIKEQKKISELLEKCTSIIATNKQMLEKYDMLIKSRFIEMFGDPVQNPKKWDIKKLSDYILFLTSGSRGWSEYFSNEGELFLTIKNVKNNRINIENIQYVQAPNNKEAERTKVKENDLLISITADLGRTGVVSKEIANYGAYINQHLSLVRLNTEKVNPLFVSYYLETDGGKLQFNKKNQSAVKAGLNFEAIKSLTFMNPPLKKQNEFVSFVQQIDKSKFAVQKSLEKAETLYKSLMQEYFG